MAPPTTTNRRKPRFDPRPWPPTLANIMNFANLENLPSRLTRKLRQRDFSLREAENGRSLAPGFNGRSTLGSTVDIGSELDATPGRTSNLGLKLTPGLGADLTPGSTPNPRLNLTPDLGPGITPGPTPGFA
ncbi:hypothetical protein ACRE_083590 [Hapsidospora chrysogenum ATCC 11550]|uniref:Uncharacterized protein n=1 Tax=Hapsidospora chrysogenum (strain ATCC 11550 / CBS 779.69 / DSM 880 / IAM 14645 / JCM 23072 / IMI 49137) TaxID=857340 RepID=A0A086SV05_HAPC1|nr:hypothetical protein ACRE_083590 [Hapsidospora chrysogenum ATCC 11550]